MLNASLINAAPDAKLFAVSAAATATSSKFAPPKIDSGSPVTVVP